jgi:uncharacterized protein YndB with AHSA1/START domain
MQWERAMPAFIIEWNVHLQAPPEVVHRFIASPEGRARFWATSALEQDGIIRFSFPNGDQLEGRILRDDPPRVFECEYFGSSVVTFELEGDERGGTDLHLRERGSAHDSGAENRAGWVSVLLTLKAAADHDVDLRNHDPERTWAQGFVDN